MICLGQPFVNGNTATKWECSCPLNMYNTSAGCVTRLTYAQTGCSITQFGVQNGMCYDYLGLICWANNTCSFVFNFFIYIGKYSPKRVK